jgi:hypothetical protein
MQRCAARQCQSDAFNVTRVLSNVASARLALLAQHDKQIEWIGLGDAQHGENRMSLAAMVRLVIEEMGEYFPTALALRRAIESSIL